MRCSARRSQDPAKELETSPRGITWPPLPHDDKAGWERVRKVGPFFTEHNATCGAGGITKDKPVVMGAYPYPIFTVYASAAENDVYMLTKAMIEGYDGYKDNAPGATGLGVKIQTKNWAVPVHKGAVKALKEAGAWSDDQEKFNNASVQAAGRVCSPRGPTTTRAIRPPILRSSPRTG